MRQIESFIEIAKLTRKQVYRNLTVFPLLAPDGIEPDYLTLEQNLIRILFSYRRIIVGCDTFFLLQV